MRACCLLFPYRFEEYTISQFARVKDIHIILLVVTLVGLVAFVFMVFRPYVAKMRSESKVFAGAWGQGMLPTGHCLRAWQRISRANDAAALRTLPHTASAYDMPPLLPLSPLHCPPSRSALQACCPTCLERLMQRARSGWLCLASRRRTARLPA
jgi:hypothetical protein